MDLANKVAIITGAGRGIGREVALSLAAEGVRVVLVSRTASQLDQVADQINSSGGAALALPIDLGSPGSTEKIIEKTLDAYKGIDLLINNAAVLFATDYTDVTEEEWDLVMNINLKAPFFLSQKTLPEMKKRGGGYIINISSTAALTVPPGIATYGISKKAVIGLSEALYEKAKEYNVKVSVIYPGMTDTEMLRGFNPPVSSDKWMKTEDIVGCIMFLLKQSERVVVKEVTPWSTGHDKI
jgi:3-oxoacyl-[acyl-carrier protein] reductase